MKFFITGLPRSRTAWFAAFMTHDDIFCWHEALNGCLSKQDFYDRMELPFKHVGNADCGLILTNFQEKYPDAPTVVIHREEKPEPMVGMKDGLWSIIGYHVNYDDIDENLDAIHFFLTGKHANPHRVALFSKFNIQLKEITGDPRSLEVWR